MNRRDPQGQGRQPDPGGESRYANGIFGFHLLRLPSDFAI
jgi:hypothetical protein